MGWRSRTLGSVEPMIVGTGCSIGVSPVAGDKALTFIAVLVAFADSDIEQTMTCGTCKGHLCYLAHDI